MKQYISARLSKDRLPQEEVEQPTLANVLRLAVHAYVRPTVPEVPISENDG